MLFEATVHVPSRGKEDEEEGSTNPLQQGASTPNIHVVGGEGGGAFGASMSSASPLLFAASSSTSTAAPHNRHLGDADGDALLPPTTQSSPSHSSLLRSSADAGHVPPPALSVCPHCRCPILSSVLPTHEPLCQSLLQRGLGLGRGRRGLSSQPPKPNGASLSASLSSSAVAAGGGTLSSGTVAADPNGAGAAVTNTCSSPAAAAAAECPLSPSFRLAAGRSSPRRDANSPLGLAERRRQLEAEAERLREHSPVRCLRPPSAANASTFVYPSPIRPTQPAEASSPPKHTAMNSSASVCAGDTSLVGINGELMGGDACGRGATAAVSDVGDAERLPAEAVDVPEAPSHSAHAPRVDTSTYSHLYVPSPSPSRRPLLPIAARRVAPQSMGEEGAATSSPYRASPARGGALLTPSRGGVSTIVGHDAEGRYPSTMKVLTVDEAAHPLPCYNSATSGAGRSEPANGSPSAKRAGSGTPIRFLRAPAHQLAPPAATFSPAREVGAGDHALINTLTSSSGRLALPHSAADTATAPPSPTASPHRTRGSSVADQRDTMKAEERAGSEMASGPRDEVTEERYASSQCLPRGVSVGSDATPPQPQPRGAAPNPIARSEISFTTPHSHSQQRRRVVVRLIRTISGGDDTAAEEETVEVEEEVLITDAATKGADGDSHALPAASAALAGAASKRGHEPLADVVARVFDALLTSTPHASSLLRRPSQGSPERAEKEDAHVEGSAHETASAGDRGCSAASSDDARGSITSAADASPHLHRPAAEERSAAAAHPSDDQHDCSNKRVGAADVPAVVIATPRRSRSASLVSVDNAPRPAKGSAAAPSSKLDVGRSSSLAAGGLRAPSRPSTPNRKEGGAQQKKGQEEAPHPQGPRAYAPWASVRSSSAEAASRPSTSARAGGSRSSAVRFATPDSAAPAPTVAKKGEIPSAAGDGCTKVPKKKKTRPALSLSGGYTTGGSPFRVVERSASLARQASLLLLAARGTPSPSANASALHSVYPSMAASRSVSMGATFDNNNIDMHDHNVTTTTNNEHSVPASNATMALLLSRSRSTSVVAVTGDDSFLSAVEREYMGLYDDPTLQPHVTDEVAEGAAGANNDASSFAAVDPSFCHSDYSDYSDRYNGHARSSSEREAARRRNEEIVDSMPRLRVVGMVLTTPTDSDSDSSSDADACAATEQRLGDCGAEERMHNGGGVVEGTDRDSLGFSHAPHNPEEEDSRLLSYDVALGSRSRHAAVDARPLHVVEERRAHSAPSRRAASPQASGSPPRRTNHAPQTHSHRMMNPRMAPPPPTTEHVRTVYVFPMPSSSSPPHSANTSAHNLSAGKASGYIRPSATSGGAFGASPSSSTSNVYGRLPFSPPARDSMGYRSEIGGRSVGGRAPLTYASTQRRPCVPAHALPQQTPRRAVSATPPSSRPLPRATVSVAFGRTVSPRDTSVLLRRTPSATAGTVSSLAHAHAGRPLWGSAQSTPSHQQRANSVGPMHSRALPFASSAVSVPPRRRASSTASVGSSRRSSLYEEVISLAARENEKATSGNGTNNAPYSSASRASGAVHRHPPTARRPSVDSGRPSSAVPSTRGGGRGDGTVPAHALVRKAPTPTFGAASAGHAKPLSSAIPLSSQALGRSSSSAAPSSVGSAPGSRRPSVVRVSLPVSGDQRRRSVGSNNSSRSNSSRGPSRSRSASQSRTASEADVRREEADAAAERRAQEARRQLRALRQRVPSATLTKTNVGTVADYSNAIGQKGTRANMSAAGNQSGADAAVVGQCPLSVSVASSSAAPKLHTYRRAVSAGAAANASTKPIAVATVAPSRASSAHRSPAASLSDVAPSHLYMHSHADAPSQRTRPSKDGTAAAERERLRVAERAAAVAERAAAVAEGKRQLREMRRRLAPTTITKDNVLGGGTARVGSGTPRPDVHADADADGDAKKEEGAGGDAAHTDGVINDVGTHIEADKADSASLLAPEAEVAPAEGAVGSSHSLAVSLTSMPSSPAGASSTRRPRSAGGDPQPSAAASVSSSACVVPPPTRTRTHSVPRYATPTRSSSQRAPSPSGLLAASAPSCGARVRVTTSNGGGVAANATTCASARRAASPLAASAPLVAAAGGKKGIAAATAASRRTQPPSATAAPLSDPPLAPPNAAQPPKRVVSSPPQSAASAHENTCTRSVVIEVPPSAVAADAAPLAVPSESEETSFAVAEREGDAYGYAAPIAFEPSRGGRSESGGAVASIDVSHVSTVFEIPTPIDGDVEARGAAFEALAGIQ